MLKNEGIHSFFILIREIIRTGQFNVLNFHLKKSSMVHTRYLMENYDYQKMKLKTISDKVSVIIPTNTTSSNLQPLLTALKNQEGIEDLEIVLINSGNHDLSTLSDSKIKVIKIEPQDFQHGRTRNFGVEKSSGKYLMFTVGDALPASNFLLYKMVKTLIDEPEIGAVTAKQIQKQNANMGYTISMFNHYQNMGINKDKIQWTDDYEKLTQSEKSFLARIDDVCVGYRRDIFLKFKYKEINFGEDMELGIRLAKSGMKIARIYSDGVFHSHDRTSSYHLKRYYVGIMVQVKLFGYGKNEFIKLDINSLNDFSQQVLPLYNSLCLTIDELRTNPQSYKIDKMYKTIQKKMKKYYGNSTKPIHADKSLDEIFTIIFNSRNVKPTKSYEKNPLKWRFNHFNLWKLQYQIQKAYPNLKTVNNEVIDILSEQFGQFVGSYLAQFYFNKPNDKDLKSVHEFLMKGV